MALWDYVAGVAGLKALQAGADAKILQAGLDLALIPPPLRDHANEILKQRYLLSEITDNRFDAAMLKLGVFYANAESAGHMQLAAAIYSAIDHMRSMAGSSLSPSINLEVIAASGIGPSSLGGLGGDEDDEPPSATYETIDPDFIDDLKDALGKDAEILGWFEWCHFGSSHQQVVADASVDWDVSKAVSVVRSFRQELREAQGDAYSYGNAEEEDEDAADLSDSIESDFWFDEKHQKLHAQYYETGEISDEEFEAARRHLILEECAALIDRRMKPAKEWQ